MPDMSCVQNVAKAMQKYHQHVNSSDIRMAIHLDNSSTWLEIDQVATELGWVIVPVPHFFSVQQIQYLINQSAIDCVWCAPEALMFWQQMGFKGQTQNTDAEPPCYFLSRTVEVKQSLPVGTHKITFTSGTTSEPKGVCLSYAHLNRVGQSLAEAVANLGITNHISLLPYSILLENMAAVYAHRFVDLEIISLPMAEVGMTGSGQLDIATMFQMIKTQAAESMIMMPQMLKQLVQYLTAHPQDVSFIKFIAVGGAVCAVSLIEQAQQMGLPVYQGYGISECGSVVSLCGPDDTPGSVGKTLPHCELDFTAAHEIRVKGPLFLGYLGVSESDPNGIFYTGDIGRLDQQGCLHITGRKKNLIINSFGRNILPDWIEGELLALPGVQQAAVYGNDQPFLTALCVTALNQAQLDAAISGMNQQLPDYANIRKAVKVPAFTAVNGQLTASGKIKAQVIFEQHKNLLETIYAPNNEKRTAHAV